MFWHSRSVNSDNLRRVLFSATVLAVIALVPLVILPGVLLYFDITPKILVLLLGTAASLMLTARDDRPRSREARLFVLLLVCQGVFLALSTSLSVNPWLSVTGTNWRRFGLLVQSGTLLFGWLCVRYLSSGAGGALGRIILVLRVVALAGSVVALYGISQYFGWDPLLPRSAYQAGEDVWTIVRPPATLGHAGYLATYLILVVFCGVGLAASDRGRAWKSTGLIAAIAGGVAIVLCGSRGGLLGLTVAGAIFVFWARPHVRLRTVALVSVVLLVASTGFYYSPAGQRIRSRVHWSREDVFGGARLYLWRDTLRMAKNRWIIGRGPETFTAEFARVQSTELARKYPDFHHESPHNVFLDALIAQGVAGPAILLLVCALSFRAARRARPAAPGMAGALLASFTGMMISLQFQAFIMPSALCLYVSAAMLVTLVPAVVTKEPAGTRLPRWVFRNVAVCTATLLIVFAVGLTVADRSLALIKAHLGEGQLKEAVAEHARLAKFQRGNFELWYSRSLLAYAQQAGVSLPDRLEALREALDAALRATHYPEEPHNGFYNLAAAFAAWNDLGRTAQSLKQAIDCSPTWYKPHWLLAKTFRLTGDLEEAKKEADLAAYLSNGKHAAVTEERIEIAKLLAHK